MRRTVNMGGIIFVLIQMIILFILAGCTPAGAADGTPGASGFNITLTELIAVFSFIAGLFGVWIDVRLRIKSLEIRTRQNETTIRENKSENYSDVCEIKTLIKENAIATQDELKNITKQVNSLHVMFAEKFGKS